MLFVLFLGFFLKTYNVIIVIIFCLPILCNSVKHTLEFNYYFQVEESQFFLHLPSTIYQKVATTVNSMRYIIYSCVCQSSFVNSELVCLLPDVIFNYVTFIWNVCFSGMPVNWLMLSAKCMSTTNKIYILYIFITLYSEQMQVTSNT